MTSCGWWHQSGSPSFKVIPNCFEGGPKLAFMVIYLKIVVVFTGAQKSCLEVPRKYSRSIWRFFRILKMYKPTCSKFLSRVFSPESRLFSPESRLFSPELKSAKSAKIAQMEYLRVMKFRFLGSTDWPWTLFLDPKRLKIITFQGN